MDNVLLLLAQLIRSLRLGERNARLRTPRYQKRANARRVMTVRREICDLQHRGISGSCPGPQGKAPYHWVVLANLRGGRSGDNEIFSTFALLTPLNGADALAIEIKLVLCGHEVAFCGGDDALHPYISGNPKEVNLSCPLARWA